VGGGEGGRGACGGAREVNHHVRAALLSTASGKQVFRASIRDAEAEGMVRFAHPYKNLARLLEKNGRVAEAQPLFDRAAEMLRDDALLFYSRLLLPCAPAPRPVWGAAPAAWGVGGPGRPYA
jgi:hypothetical protein